MRNHLMAGLCALALAAPNAGHAAQYVLVQAGSVIAVPGEAPHHRVTVIVRDGRIARIADGWLPSPPAERG